jgi:hypothetical protein
MMLRIMTFSPMGMKKVTQRSTARRLCGNYRMTRSSKALTQMFDVMMLVGKSSAITVLVKFGPLLSAFAMIM